MRIVNIMSFRMFDLQFIYIYRIRGEGMMKTFLAIFHTVFIL